MRTSKRQRLFRRRSAIEKRHGWWQEFQRRHGCRSEWQETTWETIARDSDGRLTIGARMLYGRETAHVTRVLAWEEFPTIETPAQPYEFYMDETAMAPTALVDEYATQPMRLIHV